MRIAVIPARGGSKRIPRKNIKEFCGKPILSYTIEVAKETKLFDKIYVSSEDEEILNIAKQYGADCIKRPLALSDDYTGMRSVVLHAIKYCMKNGINKPDAVCSLMATAPLIQSNNIKEGFVKLDNGCWEYVFSATKYGYPVYRSFKKLKSEGLEMLFSEFFNTRSQDLSSVYHDAGQFCWGSLETWDNIDTSITTNSTIVDIPEWRVTDIDTEDDWKFAEIQYNYVHSKNVD